jgi:uncharacterized glyoxalase superfamily protein PhnB
MPEGRGLHATTFDDVDEAARTLQAHGVVQLRSPVSQPWGERNMYVVDPDGNPIQITAAMKREEA